MAKTQVQSWLATIKLLINPFTVSYIDYPVHFGTCSLLKG